jgi:hypothetical protein
MPTLTPAPNADFAASFARNTSEQRILTLIFESPDPYVRLAIRETREVLDLGVYWVHFGRSHTWPVRAVQVDIHAEHGSMSRMVWVYIDPNELTAAPVVSVQQTEKINPDQADGKPSAMGLAPTQSPPARVPFFV